MLFLLLLRFGQISPLAFWWFTATLDRNAESCNRIPSNYCLHSCCLSHHVFDQVNLWPAWVECETAIFWQCSPGTAETQRLYPLRHGPRRAIKDGFFWSYKSLSVLPGSGPYRIFVLVFNWNHFEMRFLNLRINFYLLRTFFLILVVFKLFLLSLRFGQISPLAFFRWFTATLDRNTESCNRITWRRPEGKFGRNVVKKKQHKNYHDEEKKAAINKN